MIDSRCECDERGGVRIIDTEKINAQEEMASGVGGIRLGRESDDSDTFEQNSELYRSQNLPTPHVLSSVSIAQRPMGC